MLLNFRGFVRSVKFFLTVDYCNMDKRLESSWRLVYYQVSGEPGITRCSRWSDINLVECGLARKLIHRSSPHNFIFRVFNFRSWSRPWNYFNSEIFLIYSTFKRLQHNYSLHAHTWYSQSSGKLNFCRTQQRVSVMIKLTTTHTAVGICHVWLHHCTNYGTIVLHNRVGQYWF